MIDIKSMVVLDECSDDLIKQVLNDALRGIVTLFLFDTRKKEYIALGMEHVQKIKAAHPKQVSLQLHYQPPITEPGRIVKFHEEHMQEVGCGTLLVRKSEIDALKQEMMPKQPSEEFSSAAKNTLLQLLLGMAISKYEYNPESGRNSATGSNKNSISADLQRFGVSVIDDTIREHLRDAVSKFPQIKLIK